MAGSGWTRELELVFERALVLIDENTPDSWEKIGALVGKSVEDVKRRYEDVIIDIMKIQAGLFPVPKYEDDYSDESDDDGEDSGEQSANEKIGQSSVHCEEASSSYGKTKKASVSCYRHMCTHHHAKSYLLAAVPVFLC